MALFPTRAEAMAWQSISELVTWAGLNIDAFKAFEEVVGHLGSNIRNVALLPADTIVAAGTYAKLNGAALHPIQIVQWGLVWRLARRIALTAEGGPAAWDDYIDVDPFAPPPASTAPPAAPAAAAAKGRIVKMAEVLDQGDASEIPLADDNMHIKWSQNYGALTGGEQPVPEDQPSLEQLTALDHRTRELHSTPYADFGVFGPFDRKVRRNMKFRAWLPLPGGGWMARELPGPANFEQWQAAWRVFATACLMLGIVARAALDGNARHIERLSALWPEAWHLVYMADDKLRCDHIERLRRTVRADLSAGKPAPREWDPAKPWTALFYLATADRDYWNDQVTNPATAWAAKGGKGVPLDPDERLVVRILPGGASAVAPTGWGRYAARAEREKQVCFQFSKGFGACRLAAPGSRCPAGRRHVCHVCFSPNHAGHEKKCQGCGGKGADKGGSGGSKGRGGKRRKG
ncbi:unnamed protein product [Prorocentrum cordatum]|uniref:Uncharacterized protein n=1 Tax=Prorocentrum cordatum TaxID=2364126 RepID=A0ABN9PUQ1_9DINO|nr:unnamed protein product [Polarella glacialis]